MPALGWERRIGREEIGGWDEGEQLQDRGAMDGAGVQNMKLRALSYWMCVRTDGWQAGTRDERAVVVGAGAGDESVLLLAW